MKCPRGASYVVFNEFVIETKETLLYHNAGCTKIPLCKLRIGLNDLCSYNFLFDENSLALRRNCKNSFMNIHAVLSHNWVQFGKSSNIILFFSKISADHLIYACKIGLPYIPT